MLFNTKILKTKSLNKRKHDLDVSVISPVVDKNLISNLFGGWLNIL